MRATSETFERRWTRLLRPHWERLRANGLARVTAYDAPNGLSSAWNQDIG
jgi:hypothetical protein